MRTVLITGAARGIGRACAEAFAAQGDRVILHYHRSAELAAELREKLSASGAEVMTVCADIGDSAAVEKMFEQIYARYERLDVLVNNAGAAHVGLLTDMTDAQWDRLLACDLSGVFYCCRAALPPMIRAHSGVIINIASMWGETGASCEAAYSAVKAGVIGLTKALAKEVGPSGIRVNAVSPGVVMTDMMRDFSAEDIAALRDEIPLGDTCTPEDVAGPVLFLSSDQAAKITGQVLGVNGGMVI